MTIAHLTDRKVRVLTTDRQQEDFWDQSFRSFGIRVSRHGRKSFVVMYSGPRGRRRMTLGSYPTLSLAEGRRRAKEVLYDVAHGNDPQEEKVAERNAETFADLAEEYLERHARMKKRRWVEDERILERDLLPFWKSRKAKDIKRRDVVVALDRIVERGAPIMANRTRALISKVFNFGIGREIVEHNPCMGVPRPGKERQRDRVLNETEIQTLWRSLDSLEPVMAATFKMRLSTAQRGLEVLTMRWEHVNGSWWTIPPEATKNSLAHRVPISPQSEALLEDLRGVTGGSPWVFASRRREGAHITAVQKASERISEASGIEFVPHDLRRTAASFMTSMGVSRLVVSKILNHVESGVTAVYDRHSYDEEKRQALLLWGDRLASIISG